MGTVTGTNGIWHAAPLAALDLEGSGAQDRDAEAILEIAVVPLDAGRPQLADAFSTLVNPGRPIMMRPWISPGLTNPVLGAAPPIGAVVPELAARLDGRYLVGHNVRVDWRLLRRHCPTLAPAGLIDTLRLARELHLADGNSLTSLLYQLGLVDQVNTAAPHSRPHRALWDTVAVALLLPALITRIWPSPPTLTDLLHRAAVPTSDHRPVTGPVAEAPDTLF
jgi:DNA polymerase-3 subunit epsilon/exodeoxyribonuclease X